jgi:predicted dithiol-disulfide oxidoreductase (DUF899 family)
MNAEDRAALERELAAAEKALLEDKRRVAGLRKRLAAEAVEDCRFQDGAGKSVALSSLFGDKDDLIVVHPMGKGCRYCTLWADGFESLRPHLENRAAFALVSPDPPAQQAEFARSRGWTFPVLSDPDKTFFRAMGFLGEQDLPQPGVSTFRRDGDTLRRVGKAYFGPGDDFCSVWHFFDLLAEGAGDWQPQYRYGEAASAEEGR